MGVDRHYSFTLESRIVAAAHELAELHAETGDWDKAVEAVHQAKLASDLDETLTADLVRAYRELGQVGVALRAVEDWETQVSALGIYPSDTPRQLLAS